MGRLFAIFGGIVAFVLLFRFSCFLQGIEDTSMSHRPGILFTVRKNNLIQATLFSAWLTLSAAQLINMARGFHPIPIRILNFALITFIALRNSIQIEFREDGVSFRKHYSVSEIIPYENLTAKGERGAIIILTSGKEAARIGRTDERHKEAIATLKEKGCFGRT